MRVNICMIGAGYVGLVSAACFSEFGWTVTCVDKDPQRLKELNSGISPIYEPGLEDLMERNMKAGRLRFTEELGPAVRDADIVFLAVGTPMRRGDGHADLSYVFSAVADLAPHLDGFTVITTKSTVPVGTSREIEKRLKELGPTPITPCAPIRSSCARARPSRISRIPTAFSSAPTASGPRR